MIHLTLFHFRAETPSHRGNLSALAIMLMIKDCILLPFFFNLFKPHNVPVIHGTYDAGIGGDASSVELIIYLEEKSREKGANSEGSVAWVSLFLQ